MADMDSLWILLAACILMLHVRHVYTNDPGIQHEICYRDTFDAQCPQGQVIIMRRSQFGRMRVGVGRCAQTEIGCTQDVSQYMDNKCSGKSECKVKGLDGGLVELSNCPSSQAPYLETAYDCVEVVHGIRYEQECDSRNEISIEASSGGVLSSSQVYRRHNRGPACPYTIEALPGQVVNVTLVDFGVSDMSGSYGSCHEYAEIRESVSSQAVSVCRGRVRERNVFTSISNKIQIRFMEPSDENDQASFLLKFSVTGCADPDLSGNMVLERTHSKAIVYCESTGKKQTLICEGHEWNESSKLCTGRSTWNTGILVVLGIGILIGMIIGSCVFLSILYCIRKRREQTRRQNTDGFYSTYGHKAGGNYPSHTFPRKSLPSDKQDYMTAGYDQQAARDATLRKPVNHPYEPVR